MGKYLLSVDFRYANMWLVKDLKSYGGSWQQKYKYLHVAIF